MKTSTKLFHVITLIVFLMAAFPVMGVSAKRKTPKTPKTDKKVVFCHRKGNGGFVRINVSKKASKAHLKHGDGYPGQAVPNQEGKWFDASCKVIEAVHVEESNTLGPLEWGTAACPAGYKVVGGGYESDTATVLTSQAAKEGVEPYPVYTYYNFVPPEEGWAVQNGATPQTIVVFADCLPTSP